MSLEVVGLAIGVVCLIGAFKDAIDLFNLFTASRDFGRDFTILLAKLDIEKFLLLQWAEQVQLLSFTDDEFHHGQLNRADTRGAVSQILECVTLLLGDASQLKERYGVEDIGKLEARAGIDTATRAQAMSGPCMQRFEQSFGKLSVTIRERQMSAKTWAKVRWSICDKKKFTDLISELAHFNTKLRQIVPPVATSLARTAELSNTKDLEQIRDLAKLRIVLEASEGHRGAIAGPARGLIDQICQDRMLQTLWFRKMDDRRESIKPAHSKTFQWVFGTSDPKKKRKGKSLPSWLLEDSGIYWISGKAGEWKVHAHENTQDGLSRALLFKIFSRYPALLPQALPSLWKEVNDGCERPAPPSQAEVNYAFEIISTHEGLPAFCFFIDGLDEYVGDPRTGIALIHRLAMNPQVKIVVSSRPEPHCVSAFEDLPSMQLQELTRTDIAAYVHDVIGENKYMHGLLRSDPEQSTGILHEIVDKASGVFLWVVLACRSVLDGCDDHDSINELRDRVRELPSELKDMFTLMLSKVNKRCGDQAAKLLRLCFLNTKGRGQSSMASGALYSIELVFIADYVQSSSDPIRFIPKSDRHDVCKQLSGRLRSRCGGLLEPVAGRPASHSAPFCFCLAADWGSEDPLLSAVLDVGGAHDPLVDSTITFMHRSVYDFLMTEEAWQLECLKTAVVDFDFAQVMSLSRLHLAVQSQGLRCPEELQQLVTCLQDGMCWGAEADRKSQKESIFWKMSGCLDSLQSANEPLFGFWSSQFEELAETHSHEHDGIFSHATLIMGIEAGASNFVSSHPSLASMAQEAHPSCGCLPLLYHAVKPTTLLGTPRPDTVSQAPWRSTTAANGTIGILLSAGCDPNGDVSGLVDRGTMSGRPANSASPWTLWLQNQVHVLSSDSKAGMTHESKLTILDELVAFLEAGADLESAEDKVESIRRSLWTELGLRPNVRQAMQAYHKQRRLQGLSNLEAHGLEQPAVCVKRRFEGVHDVEKRRKH